ncbi:hypothetical protein [Actinocorallia longicatena]|uniref:PknH-like protein n=1 Tax=Actinocorallia longicatena TaxID=111803 RepID=A0ABP6QIN2_9ACTN
MSPGRQPAPGRRPPRRKGPGPVVFFGAAAGLILVVAAAVIVILMTGDDDGRAQTLDAVAMGRPAANGTSPSSYSSSPSSDVFVPIETRARDGAPLTAAELFPEKTLIDETAKTALTRRAVVLDGDCAKAMWGSGLGRVLRAGGCSQAGRALYGDTAKGFAVTIGVFNLRDSEAADTAVAAFGAGTGGFVRPLPGKGALSKFGQGFSMARGVAMGHYVVITWAQRTDGTGDERSKPLLSLVLSAAKAEAIYERAAA